MTKAKKLAAQHGISERHARRLIAASDPRAEEIAIDEPNQLAKRVTEQLVQLDISRMMLTTKAKQVFPQDTELQSHLQDISDAIGKAGLRLYALQGIPTND